MEHLPYFLFSIGLYALALLCALYALWRSRTTQGATAWVVSLLGFPLLMIPLFLIFGRNKFQGYVRERKELDRRAQDELRDMRDIDQNTVAPPPELQALAAIAKSAHQPCFLPGNKLKLLINGEATYDSMFEAIASAQKYILFQFYVIRDDEIGLRFAEALIKKAREGVRVYALYDAIGTRLHAKYLKRLKAAGVEIERFNSTKSIFLGIQINFRNHRKVLVADGRVAFTGGFNIGDDYLGRYPKLGPWRDTHVRIEGPAALAAQISFLKDWHWAKEEILDLDWKFAPVANAGSSHALVLHTGPADESEVALFAHSALINSAKSRVWIANPYVVPPEGLMDALSLAHLRGVDVRILVPSRTDNLSVKYASEVYLEKLLALGVRVYRYMPGFLHQKVMLIDDRVASIGSVNLDARSLFVNFEISAILPDAEIAREVAVMLERDYGNSREIKLAELRNRPRWKQIRARALTLLAPIL